MISMRMINYILKRIILLIPVLLTVITITFIISKAVPVDPVIQMLGGESAMITDEQYQKMKHELGLDQPIHIQYLTYLKKLLKGDLGWSYHTYRPIILDIKQYFMATIELTTISMLIVILVGIPLGVISAVKNNSIIDHFVRIFSLGGIAIPIFWLGLMMQIVFYRSLDILPIGGRVSSIIIQSHPIQKISGIYTLDSLLTGNWIAFQNVLKHAILPTIALSYRAIGLVVRMTRSSVLEILNQDYIRTARACGYPKRITIYKYTLKNAMIPILTVLGLAYGGLIRGSWLVEAVFDWPGIGLYGYQSIITLDYPAIIAVALVSTICYVIVNLLIDVLYTYVDPRIKM